jgi:hypothetical protein
MPPPAAPAAAAANADVVTGMSVSADPPIGMRL